MVKLFGIPNCDKVKKSQKWLGNHGINYEFHDYKKKSITNKQLTEWCKQVDWEALLNKRSRTWKELSEKDRSNLTQTKAVQLMQQHPTLIKRPVVQNSKSLLVGFDNKLFAKNFK